nr:transmembrane protein 87A-like [Chelonoidis abingdonii]
MFNGSSISLQVLPKECSPGVTLNVTWYLRSSHCHNEVYMNEKRAETYLTNYKTELEPKSSGQYILHSYKPFNCSHAVPLELNVESFELPTQLDRLTNLQLATRVQRRGTADVQPKDAAKDAAGNPKSSAVKLAGPPDKNPEAAGKPSETQGEKLDPGEAGGAKKLKAGRQGKSELYAVAETWEDGPYVFILKIEGQSKDPKAASNWELTIDVRMKHPHYQYISASEWPLMAFYMAMCIVYVFYGVLWLGLLACYWRDILRIQFWIGGVILLGMLEKAVFYAEFQSIQSQGVSVQGAVIFAEVLCAVKRMLARVLVIIASLGYGIVKPRLGALLNRVVGVGLMYLLFSIIEGVLRVKSDQGSPVTLVCNILLAFVDSCIVLWISFTLHPWGRPTAGSLGEAARGQSRHSWSQVPGVGLALPGTACGGHPGAPCEKQGGASAQETWCAGCIPLLCLESPLRWDILGRLWILPSSATRSPPLPPLTLA